MKRLVIASNNSGKCAEVKSIFADVSFQVLTLKDLNISINVVEDQNSFEGNAMKKAIEIMNATGEITLADDSGLEVDVLGGQPGVDSAIFAGYGATDAQNNEKLLSMLKGVPIGERSASFCCVLAVAFPDGRKFIAEGRVFGTIATQLMGAVGFGYDPIFIPDGYDKTFAQLDKSIKNAISHRAMALSKVKRIFSDLSEVDNLK